MFAYLYWTCGREWFPSFSRNRQRCFFILFSTSSHSALLLGLFLVLLARISLSYRTIARITEWLRTNWMKFRDVASAIRITGNLCIINERSLKPARAKPGVLKIGEIKHGRFTEVSKDTAFLIWRKCPPGTRKLPFRLYLNDRLY